ncbi:MAG: glycosyltransferase family 2 protein [Bacteroidales bacterium]|jgi:GT2 family glycosyltransferase|nr:glycosyltransferase family 2 protein [Bacteroidales bacterium]MCR5570996.1 glycosyltransferase family 2 protein [Bacteroidales bacterium]
MADTLVIIVTYNGRRWIEKAVSSVRASERDADIFVVDNASTDGTPDWLEEQGVETDRMMANHGFGAANNIGLRRALERGYRYVYLLNQDAWLLPDTLGRLAAFLDEHPEYGLVSPMQMKPDLASLDDQFARHYPHFFMAAHWMLRRECIEKVGGFSPAFPHYGEDVNYLDRARFHGFKCGVVESARAVHDRDRRPRPKDYRMRLKLITAKTRISDPSRKAFLQVFWQPLVLLAMAAKNFSWTLVRSIPELVRSYPELLSLRRVSRGVGQDRPTFL